MGITGKRKEELMFAEFISTQCLQPGICMQAYTHAGTHTQTAKAE